MAEREPSDHYFAQQPVSAVAGRERQVDVALPDVAFTLRTLPGVFSPTRIDPGTKILLQSAPVPADSDLPAGDLADIGAGYGPIACTLAMRYPTRRIWAVEVNERARQLCESNAKSLGLANISAVAPDEVPQGTSLGGWWSNPPIRIGKPALHQLIEHWVERLATGGTARIVVNRHLGADSLAEWLSQRGNSVERVVSRKGYRVMTVSVWD